MDASFRNEPFHTLNLILEPSIHNIPGGTCSDKSLSFRNLARKNGFNAFLHNAFIRGMDTHRLVRIELDGLVYFADIGNGWPAVIPFPAHESIQYTAFGMSFRSKLSNEIVSVFHKIGNEEKLMVEIPIKPKSEEEILHDIAHRFSKGTEYPFSGKVRFSAISGDEFLFLRGSYLLKFSSDRKHSKEAVLEGELPSIIQSNFGWEI